MYGSFDVYGIDRKFKSLGIRFEMPTIRFGEKEPLLSLASPTAVLSDWVRAAKTRKDRWAVVEALDYVSNNGHSRAAALALKIDEGKEFLEKLTNADWTYLKLACGELVGWRQLVQQEEKRRNKK